MKSLGKILVVLSVCLFIACAVFTYNSFDKYSNYANSELSISNNVNAYVGGDAYNYIINGTYFIAFAVYSAGSAIAGLICLISGTVIISKENKALGKRVNHGQSAND